MNRKTRRGPIVHVSWKPIEPKRRFLKRRTTRWLEAMRAMALRVLGDARHATHHAHVRELRRGMLEATTGRARIRAAQHFHWYACDARLYQRPAVA